MVNDRQEMEEITLEDIADLRPPPYMNRTATLQNFRCTNGRVGMISNDPDHHSQSIHKLWTRVMEHGRNTLGGNPSTLSKTSSTTKAAPLPHIQTPERPLPPPRNLIKKKVRLALKGPRTQGHLRHKPPPTLGSPHQNKTS